MDVTDTQLLDFIDTHKVMVAFSTYNSLETTTLGWQAFSYLTGTERSSPRSHTVREALMWLYERKVK